MPVSTDIKLTKDVWTLLTVNDVVSLTVVNNGPNIVRLKPAVGENPPAANDETGPVIPVGEGFANKDLVDLFPGVAGANRVYARAGGGDTTVFRSHA